MSPIKKLEAGDHLCCIYETEEEWKSNSSFYCRWASERRKGFLCCR